MSQSTVEVLEAALERLGPNGERWFNGSPDSDGAYCVDTAIPINGGAAERAVADAAGLAGTVSIWRWNDAPERTFSEVRAAFQKAIRSEKAKAGTVLTIPDPEPSPEPVLATFDGTAPEA